MRLKGEGVAEGGMAGVCGLSPGESKLPVRLPVEVHFMSNCLPACVDRCVCKDLSFTRLKTIARGLDNDIDLLALATGASIDCGRCRPWVARMLQTGTSAFYECFPDDARGRDLAAHFSGRRSPSP